MPDRQGLRLFFCISYTLRVRAWARARVRVHVRVCVQTTYYA
jgi:hypothetical protein